MNRIWAYYAYRPIRDLEEAFLHRDVNFDYRDYREEEVEDLLASDKGQDIRNLTVTKAPSLLDLTRLSNLEKVKIMVSPDVREIRGSFKSLDLSDNDLNVMPFIPTSVLDLDLSYNLFPFIPQQALPKKLEVLRLSGNRQVNLRTLELEKKGTLTTLAINHLGLATVPPLPPRIQNLDLAMNDLTFLEAETFTPYLKTLKVVDLRYNLLTSVPLNLASIDRLYVDKAIFPL